MGKWRNGAIALLAAVSIGLIVYQGTEEGGRNTAPRTAGLSASPDGEEPPEKPAVGYAAPSFSLTGLDGKRYELRAYRGKPVVLNFWASWCGPCRDEAPSFVKLDKLYGDRLQIIAVNLTASDSAESAREFALEYGFTFPVVLDPEGKTGESYKIRPIPTTLFIDSRGVIADGMLGALAWPDLERRAAALLRAPSSEG